MSSMHASLTRWHDHGRREPSGAPWVDETGLPLTSSVTVAALVGGDGQRVRPNTV
jgi:hypothetical protein